jgi:thiol-disulfide isomerase/thioredoxin
LTILPAGKPAADARIVTIVRAPLKGLWGDGKLLPAGADAPDLKVAGLPDDQPDRLSNYRGKVVVLVFWASWCGPCQDEMAVLQTLPPKHPEWKDKVVLLAVSGDEDKAKAVQHVKDNKWDQTRNAWAGEMALRTYHIDAIPATYIITADGKVSATDPADLEAAVAKLVK